MVASQVHLAANVVLEPTRTETPMMNGHHVPKDADILTGADGYRIPDTYLGSRTPIKIVVIGFGASAINIAHILGQQAPSNNISIQCYEKNPVLGGTWFENVYPGVACDIPAVNYQYSWSPNYAWTSFYASGGEILEYFKKVVTDHQLDGFVKLGHKVVGAWWEEERGQWRIKIEPEGNPEASFCDYAHCLINATGVLNNWKWPNVPGIEKFKKKVHTAAWDHSIDLKNKVVGVIGNGSSAVQVIPAIFDQVKHVKSFIRSSTWITAGFANKYAGEGGANFNYTEEQKKNFREKPDEYLQYRKRVEEEINIGWGAMIKGTTAQQQALEYSRMEMSRKLKGKSKLIDKMIPTNYAVGCRRPTPGNGYLECITDENKSTVTFADIKEITEGGLVTSDGTEHKFDVLICATGFDVSFRPRFPIVGKDGVDMRKAFEKSPQTYLSVTACGFPNYFMMLGPFGPYGHGSVIPAIEATTRYIEKVVKKIQTEGIKSLTPKKEAVEDFKKHRELFLKRTVWDSPCRSWFKGGKIDGPIMMWPGNRLHFFKVLESPRWEDYDFEYTTQNRFAYWGNGFTTTDAGEPGSDFSWYIDAVP